MSNLLDLLAEIAVHLPDPDGALARIQQAERAYSDAGRVSITGSAYGAVGDNSTDDGPAVQRALNAVNGKGGGRLWVPKSTYAIKTPLTVYANTVIEFDDGAVFNAAGMAGGNQVFSTSPSPTNDTPTVALTANVVRGAQTLLVGAGNEAGFLVGDYVKVGSHKQWSADTAQADNTMDGWQGEIAIVDSISSGTLVLRFPIFDSYATADSAYVSKMTMVPNVSIVGPGKIIGAGDTTNSRGFKFDRVLYGLIRDVTWVNFDDAAIVVKDGFGVVVDKIRVEGGTSHASSFYGISWQFASQWCSMVDSVFRDVRHCATLDQINGVRAGVPRHISYLNCKGYDNAATSFDAHAFGEFLSVIGCHSYNAVDQGVSVRSPSAIIANNTIVGCGGHGVYLRNQTSYPSRYTVMGNHILRAALNGINWRTPPEAALVGTTAGQVIDGVVLGDNVIIDSGGDGILVESVAGFTNLYQGDIRDNLVQFTSANTLNGINVQRLSESKVHDNIVKGANVGYVQDANCVNIERHGNRFPGCTTPESIAGSVAPTALGALGVGNAVAATTPGSVVKKVQIFDAVGNSLGFVPVYSTIT